MAKSKSGLIKVIAPGGLAHIVPEENRRTIEVMNQFAKRDEQRYKIYDYDPENPDAVSDGEKTVPFTDVLAKFANENKDLKKENEDMKKRLANLEKLMNSQDKIKTSQ